MSIPYTTRNGCARFSPRIDSITSRRSLPMVGAALGLIAAGFFATAASAQSVDFVVQPVRVTVPVNFNGSTTVTNVAVTIRTNGLSQVDGTGNYWVVNPIPLSATGVPSTPTGLSFSFSDTNGAPLTAITPVISTSEASVTTNIWMIANSDNVAEGVYTFSLDAGGDATGSLLLTFQSAHIWSGAGFTNGVTASFSAATNWNGGNVPGADSDVVLYNEGAVGHNETTTNILISADTEVGSLRQAITSGSTRRDNIQINPGVTFKITGTNGFQPGLRDRSDTYQSWELAFTGDQGTLMLSNQTADIALFAIENQTPYMYLDNLGTFIADLNQIHISDYRVYPNYASMDDNGYRNAALPRRMPEPEWHLAKTNVIKLEFPGDPDNWTNSAYHQYSMVVGNNSHVSGSTQRHPFYFGISNLFLMNSVCFAGSGVAMDGNGAARFNSDFAQSNCVAIFRGPNGMNDRMAMFALADNSGEGSSGSASKSVVNFSSGTVDALVDRLYIGRGRTNASGAQAQGTLTLSQGIFDVNTAILGFQGEGNNLGDDYGYCAGTLNVSTSAVFRVNGPLILGYTTADATNTAAAEQGYGQINVGPGGTVLADSIPVGGVTKLSANNTITLRDGGDLIVSNTIAGPDKMLTQLSFNDGGILTLHIDGNRTDPYVYTTNLVTSGANNIVRIATLQNMTFPAEIPLIAYVTGSHSLGTILPAGYTGALLDRGTNIVLSVTTHTPQNLLWRGTTADWDGTTKNWLDLATGLMTNFANGDFAFFDDAASFSSINLADVIVPSGITMTNSVLNYTFNASSGSIQGSAILNKWGTRGLQIDGPTTIAVHVNQGSLTGSGQVGSVAVASGASMSFGGSIGGGVSCAGTGTSSGSINGTLAVQDGGIFTNAAFASVDGPLHMGDGSLLYNAGSLTHIGSPTVVSNATLINAGGTISGTSMAVSGTLIDDGTGSFIFDQALTVNNGGTFVPGGEGTGTTSVYGSGTASANGRVILATGSTNIFKVDLASAQPNTMLLTAHMSFGPNQNTKAFNGGTIKVENIGTTPFSAGQSFKMFGYVFGGDVLDAGLNTTNSYSVMDPPSPGPGLAWDLSNLIPGGYVNVVSVGTNPVNFGFVPTLGTTLSTNVSGGVTNIVTNNVVFVDLDWPTNYVGWRLQQQQASLKAGLTTNWNDLWTSFTNYLQLTNDYTTNATFYRMVFP